MIPDGAVVGVVVGLPHLLPLEEVRGDASVEDLDGEVRVPLDQLPQRRLPAVRYRRHEGALQRLHPEKPRIEESTL